MTGTTQSRKVLVAIRPDAIPIVARTMGSEFDVVICHTMEDAKAKLNEQVGLIACGVHFDSGAMFDLLRYVKSLPETRSIPFFLLIGEGERYSKSILAGIRSAAEVLGAEAFTDLMRLKNKIGEEAAYEKLRQSIRVCLSKDESRIRRIDSP